MTNPTPHGQVPAIQRYKLGYHSDEGGVRSLSPTSIYDDAGPWVRYEDHAAVITAFRTQQPAPAGATLRSMIEGMSVSVDVSTGDHDAGHRYFGTVTEVMECQGDKHGVTLLVQDAEPNFAAPTPQAAQPAPATQQAREVSDAMVLAALQMQHPAAYGQYLRHPANGPKTSIRTEAEIDTARRMIAAALAAAPQPSPTAQAADSVTAPQPHRHPAGAVQCPGRERSPPMTDTTSAAPSDAEIDAQWRESVAKHETTAAFVRDFARAVLAKWGAPQQEAQAQAGAVPLTDEQIVGVMHSIPIKAAPSYHIAFARAIEQAHGLKGGQHGTE